jgi:hypothetical protein
MFSETPCRERASAVPDGASHLYVACIPHFALLLFTLVKIKFLK